MTAENGFVIAGMVVNFEEVGFGTVDFPADRNGAIGIHTALMSRLTFIFLVLRIRTRSLN